jgi:hypothetical protein
MRDKDIVFAALHLIKSLHVSYPDSAAIEEKTAREVVKVMEHHGMDPLVLTHTMETLIALAENDISGEMCTQLMIHQLTRPLLDLITFHKNDKTVITAAVKLLQIFGENNNGIQERLMTYSGADKVLLLLEQYKDDSFLVNQLVHLLSSLFFNTSDNRTELGDLGVCGLLVEIYDTRDSEEDRSLVMDAMRDLCLDNPQNEKRIRKLGVDLVDDGF